MTMYKFDRQLSKGEQAESDLDRYFGQWFQIRKATRHQQRMGIDRIYTRDKLILKVEYKADWTASRTGNAFVETVSVDTADKPGWAHTSKADVLFYYLPDDMLVYWISFVDLRNRLPEWKGLPIRKIPNKGYFTHGILVPLDEFERLAKHVICL